MEKKNFLIYEKYKSNHQENFKNFSDEIFDHLIEILNDIHKKSYSKKSWKIIIGPWYYSILNIYYFYSFCFAEKNNINQKIKKLVSKLRLNKRRQLSLSVISWCQCHCQCEHCDCGTVLRRCKCIASDTMTTTPTVLSGDCL